jgi:hypothetical protein
MNKYIAAAILLGAGALCVLPFTSCNPLKASTSTGKVFEGNALPGFKGDDAYAEVDIASLPKLHAEFASTLSDLGLVKWDSKFDCNHLTDLYIAVNQAKYAVDNWHSETKAQALAMAVIWYIRDDGVSHAIVELRTNKGTAYVDPQLGGHPVLLSQKEVNSIYFRKW